eukprot:m.155542 g.155542  ORF g.155542 m.155542 type:complete len:547 (+) comp52913_c0_seq1:1046-2686(+)
MASRLLPIIRSQPAFRRFPTSVRVLSQLSSTPPVAQKPKLKFDDAQLIYKNRSTYHLLRALVIFRLCGVRFLVDNADTIIRVSRRIFGRGLVDSVIRNTFFAHFCAGEDEKSISPRIDFLKANGVGSILDYAAEADLNSSGPSSTVANTQDILISSQPARIYKYSDEKQCDQNMRVFESCIDAVHNVTPEGFAAVKLTALGNPQLLQVMSSAILQMKTLFSSIDQANKGYLTRDEVTDWYGAITGDTDLEKAQKFMQRSKLLATSGPDRVDYETWVSLWSLKDVIKLIQKSTKTGGQLAAFSMHDEEFELLNAMYARIHRIGDFAREREVRLMIDAEQTYFQPAIDQATFELQFRHNRSFPTIFGTYQCYLKDSHSRVLQDMQRCNRLGLWFCAKIVRGAYMEGEAKYAKENSLPYPIFGSIQETHDNYNKIAKLIISSERRNLIVASHNKESIEKATALMTDLGIHASAGGIYFAQLLGMSDHLTFTLGLNGYKAYKYVPYGLVHEVIPYLLRRAQENRSLFLTAAPEIELLKEEASRRLSMRPT